MHSSTQLTATTSTEPILLLTNENPKTNTEYVELFNNLVSEYDRRLEEQVKLAKQDMLNELESQIQVRTSFHVVDRIVKYVKLQTMQTKFALVDGKRREFFIRMLEASIFRMQ